MIVAIMLFIIVIGSLVFNFLSPWWFTDIASNWGGIDFAVFVTFWICGVAFVLIGLFMVYTTWKYRRREGQTAVYEPENKRLEWILTILTTIGVVGMLAPGLLVWDDYVNVPPQAREVEITGQQWSWSYRLPGEDGVLGTVEATRISVDNPFGMDPDDPYGQDDVLIERDALHLPIDRPVKVLLRSKDVLHDFYVPEFRAKMDAVPGMITYMWFTPTRVGTYEVLCAELCGIGHHTMRGTVVVDTREDYDAWLKSQSTYAQICGPPQGRPGRGANRLRRMRGLSWSLPVKAWWPSTRPSCRARTHGICATRSLPTRRGLRGCPRRRTPTAGKWRPWCCPSSMTPRSRTSSHT